jgi:hypothetical protein
MPESTSLHVTSLTGANRPLSASEMSLARWMLEHGKPEAQAFLEQLAVTEVMPWRCPCGCASINLQISGSQPAPPGVHVLAEFLFGPDDELAGIFIYESGGLLSGIEVCALASDAPAELPRKDMLQIGHFRGKS